MCHLSVSLFYLWYRSKPFTRSQITSQKVRLLEDFKRLTLTYDVMWMLISCAAATIRQVSLVCTEKLRHIKTGMQVCVEMMCCMPSGIYVCLTWQ
jgi:hypothetical protein